MALNTGLVSYYKFDENSGTTVNDSAGSNTGAFNGSGSKWTSGIINSGGLFNGSDNQVDIPGFNNVITYSAISVQAWVKIPDGNHDYRFVANAHTDSDNKGFQLFTNSSGTAFLFQIGNGSVNTNNQKNSGITLNAWHHLIGVYDGAEIILYVDGSGQDPTHYTLGNIAASPYDLSIGNNPVYSGDWTHGQIDEVAIWNRALTPTEALILYNYGTGRQYPFPQITIPTAMHHLKMLRG